MFYNQELNKKGRLKEEGWKIIINGYHDLSDPSDDYPIQIIQVGNYIEYDRKGLISSIRKISLNETDSINHFFYNKGVISFISRYPHQKVCACKKKYGNGSFYNKNFSNGRLKSEGDRLGNKNSFYKKGKRVKDAVFKE